MTIKTRTNTFIPRVAVATALLLVSPTLVMSASAQRPGGGMHSGGGPSMGHGASMGHTPGIGSAPHIPTRPMPGLHAAPPSGRQGSRLMPEGSWTSAGYLGQHNEGSYGRDGYHHGEHRRVGYGAAGYGVGYGILGYSGIGYDPYFFSTLNYNDADDPNNNVQPTNSQPDNAQGPVQDPGYGPPPSGYPASGPADPPAGYNQARPPYNTATGSVTRAAQPQTNNAATDGLSHPKVTLIFKDGRQPIQIQNYAMTQTRLFVRDNGNERDIAISDINVPATMAANDQAGVDFALPVGK